MIIYSILWRVWFSIYVFTFMRFFVVPPLNDELVSRIYMCCIWRICRDSICWILYMKKERKIFRPYIFDNDICVYDKRTHHECVPTMCNIYVFDSSFVLVSHEILRRASSEWRIGFMGIYMWKSIHICLTTPTTTAAFLRCVLWYTASVFC